jgi:hypothetical protein
MRKAVNTDDIFGAVDGNRKVPTTVAPAAAVKAEPVSQNGNASEAEKIRAMGDRLAKIWED